MGDEDDYDDDFESELSALPSINSRGAGHIASKGMTRQDFAHAQDDNRQMLNFEKKFRKLRMDAKELITKLDKDNTGTLDKKEIPTLLEQLGVDKEDHKSFLKEFFIKFDTDGDGELSFDEFLTFYEHVLAKKEGIHSCAFLYDFFFFF